MEVWSKKVSTYTSRVTRSFTTKMSERSSRQISIVSGGDTWCNLKTLIILTSWTLISEYRVIRLNLNLLTSTYHVCIEKDTVTRRFHGYLPHTQSSRNSRARDIICMTSYDYHYCPSNRNYHVKRRRTHYLTSNIKLYS